jgi:hypothetical protein
MSATSAAAASLACAGMLAPSLTQSAAAKPAPMIKHVLLISVDGMHEADLQRFVSHHPHSTLAELARRGVDYTKARTPIPSDSFPGMVGQVTGGDPRTTGVYYDVTFNHRLLAPGTTNCSSAAAGTQVAYDESVDRDSTSIDAGQGLSGLPGSILKMTGNPRQLINPAGLRTAWSDKHPAYEILGGPSGDGIQDQFTPEINSDAPARYLDPTGKPGDWTTNNFATRQYDHYKVDAVRNEIDGLDHSGTKHVGVPAVFGLNLQTISAAAVIAAVAGRSARAACRSAPTPRSDEAHGDHPVGEARPVSRESGRAHPYRRRDDHRRSQRRRARQRSGGLQHRRRRVAAVAHRPVAVRCELCRSLPAQPLGQRHDLQLRRSGQCRTVEGAAALRPAGGVRRSSGCLVVRCRQLRSSASGRVRGRATRRRLHRRSREDRRTRRADPQDRNVPLLVTATGHGRGSHVNKRVETTQIAPTILRLLGIAPRQLQAVRIQGTRVLPAG